MEYTYIESNFFDIEKIAKSGQCFRLRPVGDGFFGLTAQNRYVRIDARTPGRVGFAATKEALKATWQPYFHLDGDYEGYVSAIDPKDRYLQAAATFSRGIRILRQEPWETLISFIISQRKNIAAIMSAIEKLALLCGEPILGADGPQNAFPTPAALSAQSLSSLCECGLGYRAPYIQQTAKLVASGALCLTEAATLSNEALLESLCRAPGVGPKVAACVMLFGYHRLDAFPKDVWINRVLENEYGGTFDQSPYLGFSGVLQQYLFYYAREQARR